MTLCPGKRTIPGLDTARPCSISAPTFSGRFRTFFMISPRSSLLARTVPMLKTHILQKLIKLFFEFASARCHPEVARRYFNAYGSRSVQRSAVRIHRGVRQSLQHAKENVLIGLERRPQMAERRTSNRGWNLACMQPAWELAYGCSNGNRPQLGQSLERNTAELRDVVGESKLPINR